MKLTLRNRYVVWLLLVVTALVALQLIAFTVYELAEIESWSDPTEVREEVGEVLVLLAVDAVILPVVFLMAWFISGRMLTPLHAVADTARRIRAGQLQERVTTTIHDDDIAALVQTVNDAFDKYQGVLRRMERFTSDASHQLRTPLAALRMLGEVSLQRERTPDGYREAIGSMLEESERLGDIVEKLLQLARLEPEQVRSRFVEVNLAQLTSDAVQSFSLFAFDQGVALEVSGASTLNVQGDPGLLRQVFSNLLDNALQHTPQGGWVRVQLSAHEGQAEVRIQDSGPGIPADNRAHIFERFYRVPGSPATGTGLGLAIVFDIITVHGGTVELASTPPGEGALFVIRLPV